MSIIPFLPGLKKKTEFSISIKGKPCLPKRGWKILSSACCRLEQRPQGLDQNKTQLKHLLVHENASTGSTTGQAMKQCNLQR